MGTFEPGKRADIVLLNLRNIEEPYIDPDVSIVDAVVHRGRGVDVDTVLVDGEVVMRDRRLTKIDKEALYKELKAALDRPYDAWETERREVSQQVVPHLFRYYGTPEPQGNDTSHGVQRPAVNLGLFGSAPHGHACELVLQNGSPVRPNYRRIT